MADGTVGRWSVASFLHRHLLALIVASYALAAVAPGPGLAIKDTAVIDLATPLGPMTATTPKLLLALLLACAGLRAKLGRVGQVVRRPRLLLAGLTANLLVPLAFLAAMVPVLRLWHNPDEAAIVLVGLALVSSMPIAGSSTGWAQAADGDMALSLGLVLGSTLLGPLTSPAALHALGAIVPGDYGGQLRRLAGGGTGAFLAAWVLLPAALGIAARWWLGEGRVAAVEPRLKVVAPVALLVLCYSNAAACLPETIRRPDWDFLAIIATFVVGLCALTFAAGYALGRLLDADRGQRASLMFALGMNNNGTGLVLAALAFDARPGMLLPIIIYNLVQHLVAGAVAALLARADRRAATATASSSAPALAPALG